MSLGWKNGQNQLVYNAVQTQLDTSYKSQIGCTQPNYPILIMLVNQLQIVIAGPTLSLV